MVNFERDILVADRDWEKSNTIAPFVACPLLDNTLSNDWCL